MSKQLAEEAIEIEPNYYAPYVMLAFINLWQGNLPLAEKNAQKSLQLNDSAPMALITMGQVYLYIKDNGRKQLLWEKGHLLLTPVVPKSKII